uniref:Uncharacterized protein ORF-c20_051 n=1 Tax=Saccharolobus solfataricus TaxID=2287 RepID=Q9UXE6_SACSO|nr:hypothetical protein [Saccharolobus solfataricus P2]
MINLLGERLRISMSAIIANGSFAFTETGFCNPFMEANGDVIPSCDGEVGILTNSKLFLNAAYFVTSITLPPPIPSSKLGLILLITSSTIYTSSKVALSISTTSYLASFGRFSMTLSAIFLVYFVPVTIRNGGVTPSCEK